MLLPNNKDPSNKTQAQKELKEWLSHLQLQFERLNLHITKAIYDKNFCRAVELDTARQDILKELCLKDPALIDGEFFAFIERCAGENASLISKVEDEMESLTMRTGRHMRAQMAYSRK